MVLHAATPPFPRLGPAKHSSPTSSVLRRRYDSPHRIPGRSLGSRPGSHADLRFSCPPRRSRTAGGAARARAFGQPGLPSPAVRRVDGTESPRFPDDPSRAFAQLQDPGRTDASWPSGWWRRCCPRGEDDEGSGDQSDFGAYHRASAPAVYASRAPLREPRQDSLPAGWLTPLPCGSRTHWIASKGFRSFTCPSSFPGLTLALPHCARDDSEGRLTAYCHSTGTRSGRRRNHRGRLVDP